MNNIGPKSREWLASIRIHSLEDIARLRVVKTYKRVKAAYPEKVTPNMLWGLQAALLDIPWSELPPDIKAQLMNEVGEDSRLPIAITVIPTPKKPRKKT